MSANCGGHGLAGGATTLAQPTAFSALTGMAQGHFKRSRGGPRARESQQPSSYHVRSCGSWPCSSRKQSGNDASRDNLVLVISMTNGRNHAVLNTEGTCKLTPGITGLYLCLSIQTENAIGR